MHFIDFKAPGSANDMFMNEGPLPKIGLKDVLVQVNAAGVNGSDLAQRAGHYPPPPGASSILGLEISGIITKIGSEVTQWKIGDQVCALTNGGGYADYCAIPEGQCLPIPEGVSLTEAASLPEAYFTVWGNIFMRAQLKKGETLLVHGGASGIGSCAIQLGKAFGAIVVATVGSTDKVAFCKDLHADKVINYKEEDFSEVLKEMGVDVILDIVGGDYFLKNLAILKTEGRLAQVSALGGSSVPLDLRTLMQKRLFLMGSTLRAQSAEAKAKIAKQLLESVWPYFSQSKLKPVVTAVFPLLRACEAHVFMESKQNMGKIVLKI